MNFFLKSIIKMVKKPTAPLYPELPFETGDPSQNVRLQQIHNIRDFLEKEVESRDKLRRRYKSTYNMFYSLTMGSGLVSVGTSSAAVGTLATGIGAPVSIPLGGVAIVSGLLSVSCSTLAKATMKKVQKHENIKYTAKTKLSSIDQIVSTALEDGTITDKEFQFILRENDSYRKHKQEIKERTRTALTTESELEKAEKKGIEVGKKLAMKSLQGMVAGGL
jgi:hypothetical protein